MTAIAARQLGCDVTIIEKTEDCPAARLVNHALTGDWNNPDELLRLAEYVDYITLENEFVDADSLARLEQSGYRLFPGAHTVALVQDKLIQKQTL